MSKNASLLVELGLTHSTPTEQSTQGSARAKRRRARIEHRDRWGHVLVLPEPGSRQRMACVEIRPDRRINRAIDAGQYYDWIDLTGGEERRWRFGDGEGGPVAEGEEAVVGGVGADFRWKSVDREVEATTDTVYDEAATKAAQEQQPKPPKVHYSVSSLLPPTLTPGNTRRRLPPVQEKDTASKNGVSEREPEVHQAVLRYVLQPVGQCKRSAANPSDTATSSLMRRTDPSFAPCVWACATAPCA